MSSEQVLLRRGLYADSVTLLQVSRQVGQADGVQAALVGMATELNLEMLAGMGFQPPGSQSPNELFIAVRAADEQSVTAAAELAEQLLNAPRRSSGAGAAEQPPRTIGSAAASTGAGLALISVPGQHAFTEAMDALDAGCDVLVFSDNVSVADEIRLKDAAAERGLLVMGPDCGTAVVGGLGLGFSHTLDRGPVGLVAASGTGAQQVLCLLDAAGVGVSAALGVGGRDLSEDVAGRSTLAALRMLDSDPGTELILVVSKPPAAPVAERVRQVADGLVTPVRFALLGPGQPDLTEATEAVLAELAVAAPDWPSWVVARAGDSGPGTAGALRGLFCGGTLCDEAMLIASAELGEVRSNIALRPEWALDAGLRWPGHLMIDFGDDALTQGRAHPMIDPSLRNRHLAELLADPDTAVVLLDVLLGHGSHPDPVAELLPVLAGASVPVVVSLIGARRDPQSPEESARRLHQAGASVFTSNAAATRHALSLLTLGGRS
ncbi:MAG: FdrA family protein [Jatrophihabitantaceae bacterium]